MFLPFLKTVECQFGSPSGGSGGFVTGTFCCPMEKAFAALAMNPMLFPGTRPY